MLENTLSQHILLNGEWEIFIGDETGTIHVPGIWERQGFPLDAEAASLKHSVHISSDWAESRIFIRFGAVSYHVEVLVNDHIVGTHEGLWSPFEFDVTDVVRLGRPNQIELRIIKPTDGEAGIYPYRNVLVGFIPYVSTTFGGPWQDIELVAYPQIVWKAVQIHPDWRSGSIALQSEIVSAQKKDLTARIEVIDPNERVVAEHEQTDLGDLFQATLTVGKPLLWSPESPHLYKVHLRLYYHDTLVAETARSFGFRGLHTHGEQLLFNGEAINLRGILSWGWNPDTFAPVFTEEEIRDEFRRVRALGFNLYKLCLYVPEPRLFEIADEEGMFLWLELPFWWQILTDHLREQAPVEYAEIMARVHHHPSVIIYSLGCELSADMADAQLLARLDSIVRQYASSALICDNSGSGEAYEGLTYDYADFNDYHFYAELHHFTPLVDHFKRDWRPARPWIFGEFCFSDDLRDPAELVDAHGKPLWWRNLLGVGSSIDRWAYRDQEQRLARLDLPFTMQELVGLSRKKSLLIRKVILEQVRSRRDIGGYVITGLRDTPISTAGVFDDFDRPKFDSSQFRQFNNDSILILEQGRTRSWINGDRPAPQDRYNHVAGQPVSFRLVLAHTGNVSIMSDVLHWQLLDSTGTIHEQKNVPVYQAGDMVFPRELACIEFIFPMPIRPEKWTLHASLGEIENSWSLWVYPPTPAWGQHVSLYDPAGNLGDLHHLKRYAVRSKDTSLVMTSVLTPEIIRRVQNGGRVILLQPGPGALPSLSTIFWGTSLGLIYDHPVMAHFPHEQFADLQFYHLAADHAFVADNFADVLPELGQIKPIIRNLDMRLFTASEYLVDVEVGSGTLIASTLRFCGGQGDQVISIKANVAAQYLLYQIVNYLRLNDE